MRAQSAAEPTARQTDRYDSTVIVIAPIPTAAVKGWRRLVHSVDQTKTGAFALTGQNLQPGGCYRAQVGSLIVVVDTHTHERTIRLLRVHVGGLEVVKEWRQKAPLGPRIVTFIAKRLPTETWRAAPIAGVPNRWPGRCYRCGSDLNVGAGVAVTVGGATKVSHSDQCPPVPPKPNERDGRCEACGKPVPAGTGVLHREWDDLTGCPRWTVEHTSPGACEDAPTDLPNRWTDWCADCGSTVRAGCGVWRDRAVRCYPACRTPPAIPSWRISSRDVRYMVGETFRATVAPRPGERHVPDEAPGRQVMDEGMVSVIATVIDTHTREDGLRLAQVRAATWDEAAPVLAEEVDLAVDAQPNPRGFKAAWSAERIGPSASSRGGGSRRGCSPWLAEITGHDRVYGYRRSFLPPRRDYLEANSSGTRGVMHRWILSPNAVYEAYYPTSWTKSRRVFLRVTPDGDVEEITREQVDARLRHGTAWADPCTPDGMDD